MTKINLGIVFGGVSGEHEVSKVTAFSVLNNINFNKFNVLPIYIDTEGTWFTSESDLSTKEAASFDDIDSLIYSLNVKNPNLFDFKESIDVFFPLIHGTNGEDGTIQGLFEMLKIPYVGPGVVGSAMGMDKAIMKDIFKAHNIPQGRYFVFNQKEIATNTSNFHINQKANQLGYPVFIKPANAGSSLGITKVDQEEDLQTALEFALNYDTKVIVEETIVGRELEIGILGYDDIQFSIAGEVTTTSHFYDYKEKYSNSEKTQIHIPANIPDSAHYEMVKIGSDVCKALNIFGLSRIDFFWNEEQNQFYVNEVNTIPGFTPFSMYPLLFGEVGISYPELIEKLVEHAFAAFKDNKKARIFA